MTQPDFLQNLTAIVGPANVLTGDAARPFETPVSAAGHSVSLAVVRPASTDEVAAIVTLCARSGVEIIPQGGNTNVCAMTLAHDGAILLNLSRLNRILHLNAACQTITVEAGATLQAVQEAADAAGLLFAPDWGARGSAQVGGAVATNGGGLNVLGYGTTREQVLGMEVVLADGRVWDGMRALIKNNSGYDLKQLFIGSEGTLGIITRLVFRLHPRPARQISMIAALTDKTRLMEILALAQSVAGNALTAFELMDGHGVELALGRYPDLVRPLSTRADWYVLIRLSGGEGLSDLMESLFEQAHDAGLLEDAALAQSVAQERNMWEIREQLMPAQYFLCPSVKWDVSVPIDRMMDFLDAAEKQVRGRHAGAVPYAVGHVGDGNIHYNVFFPDLAKPEAQPIIDALIETIDNLIASMGGCITAEHGVGRVYRERSARLSNPTEEALREDLKALFDPRHLLNTIALVPP